jgi:hypothetical protein
MAVVAVVNEGSSSYLTIRFKDKDGVEAAPTSASYQVGDKATLADLQGETALPAGSAVEVTLGPEVNKILDQSHPNELRVVTLRAQYGGEAVTEEYEYMVRNLRFIQ